MLILYEGPSLFNPEQQIVVLLTGDERPSANVKTGDMLQTWYLLRDIRPTTAVQTKDDVAICGDCPHRGTSCYVVVSQAPTSVWNAYQRGSAKYATPVELSTLLAYKKLRVGAYGDPGSAPSEVTLGLIRRAMNWTGYTHAWRERPEFKQYLMASCDSEDEAISARAQGWATYRIKRPGTPEMSREFPCPSPHGVQCSSCMACNSRHGNRSIEVHGAQWKVVQFTKRAA